MAHIIPARSGLDIYSLVPWCQCNFANGITVGQRTLMHGLLVWALATLLTAAFALATAQSLTRFAAPAGGFCRAGNIGRRRKYHCL